MISYLDQGDSMTAACMNDLFFGSGGFEGKLSKLLAGGKSPILAFVGAGSFSTTYTPMCLFGNPFFFCSGKVFASQCVAGFVSSGVTAEGYAYDHSQFTTAAAAIQATETAGGYTSDKYDTVNRIVTIPKISSSYYTSAHVPSASPNGRGLFDWSLQTHTVDHAVTNPDGSVSHTTYYLNETISTGVSALERRLDWAVAEIILEGQTSLTIPATWNKYFFWRVHNINPTSATVTFGLPGGGTSVLTVPAYGCKTFRRVAPRDAFTGELTGAPWTPESGDNYFFRYHAGDPRSLFYPRHVDDMTLGAIGDAMASNNVFNPSLIYDWVRRLQKRALSQGEFMEGGSELPPRAWFIVNEAANICDRTSADVPALWPAMTDSCLVGDQIHYKGRILILTNDNSNPYAAPTVSYVDFNGYSTIVADFSVKGITVTNVSGSLRLSCTDPTKIMRLIGISTNLLVNAYAGTSWASGYSSVVDLPFTIPSTPFEKLETDGSYKPNTTAGQTLLWQRTRNTVNTTIYSPFGSVFGSNNVSTVNYDSYVGGQGATVTMPTWSTTIGELKSMKWFGNSGLSSQDDSYVTYANAAVKRTPEGLLLTFDETVATAGFDHTTSTYSSDRNALYNYNCLKPWTYSSTGKTRSRVIHFRGMGFGYYAPTGAARMSVFHHPRAPMVMVRKTIAGDVVNKDGADFTGFIRAAQSSQLAVMRVLQRSDYTQAQYAPYLSKRAWIPNFYALETSVINSYVARGTNATTHLLTDAFDGEHIYGMLPACVEHFNGLAQLVNQCTAGKMLDLDCLWFWVDTTGQSTSYVTHFPPGFYTMGPRRLLGNLVPLKFWTAIVPADAYIGAGGRPANINLIPGGLYTALGIPIKTEADVSGLATLMATQTKWRELHMTASISSISVTLDAVQPAPASYAALTLHWSGSITNPTEGSLVTNGGTWNSGHATVSDDGTNTPDGGQTGIAIAPLFNTDSMDTMTVGSLDLVNAFTGFKWVSMDDVKTWADSIGWDFICVEQIRPFKLDELKMGSVEAGYFNANGPSAFTRQFHGPVGATTYPTSVVGSGNYTARRLYSQPAFYPIAVADANFKMVVFDGDTQAGTPSIAYRWENREGTNPDRMCWAVVADVEFITVGGTPTAVMHPTVTPGHGVDNATTTIAFSGDDHELFLKILRCEQSVVGFHGMRSSAPALLPVLLMPVNVWAYDGAYCTGTKDLYLEGAGDNLFFRGAYETAPRPGIPVLDAYWTSVNGTHWLNPLTCLLGTVFLTWSGPASSGYFGQAWGFNEGEACMVTLLDGYNAVFPWQNSPYMSLHRISLE